MNSNDIGNEAWTPHGTFRLFLWAMKLEIPVGLLYSTTGTYQRISNNARSGALQAVADINADAASGVTLVAHEYDPHGELEAYHQGAEDLLARGLRHVVGTTTSASRKDIVPDVERDEALLGTPAPTRDSSAARACSIPAGARARTWSHCWPMLCASAASAVC
ncbi:hypothetical protein BTW10_16195 [Chromohalobacter japonicus]|uniref:Leucine-binding protein domain-containing protein n=1 Tax=Chromohalobacter japonicus TaxID=223900 RepID=A0A1Q8T950_9GAMM|nr:hypothetical protein BTW10_16195 [Chromohalobacter japonicus]